VSLTPKQEKFAQNVAKGMTFSDAYRNSYDASKMVDETVHKRASELAQKGEIAGRIDKLKEQLSERQLWSREDSIKKLIEVMSDARPNDVIAAIKELNNMHGFDAPSKIELSGNMLHQIQRRIVDDVSDD
jgi:phage terminase small subunit